MTTDAPRPAVEKTIFLAIAALFLLLAPITLVEMTYFGVLHRLWVAFLVSNIVVWSVVLLTASLGAGLRMLAAMRGARPDAAGSVEEGQAAAALAID